MTKHLKPSPQEITTFALFNLERDPLEFQNVIRDNLNYGLRLLNNKYWMDKRGKGNGAFMGMSQIILGLAFQNQSLRTLGTFIQKGTHDGGPAEFMFLTETQFPHLPRIDDAEFAFKSITAKTNGFLGDLGSPYRLGRQIVEHL